MNNFRLFGFHLLAILFIALSACGGGGSDGNALDIPTASDYQIQLALLDQVSDEVVTEVSNNFPARLRVTLLDGDNNLAADQSLTLTVTNARLGTSTVQTDENGVAEVSVFAGDQGPASASVIASFTDPEGNPTGTTLTFESLGDEPTIPTTPVTDNEFTIGATLASGYQQGALNTGAAADGELASGSTTLITAELRNATGELITVPTVVNFTSACTTAGDSELDASVTSVNGIAEATYKATGCAGSDVVTATVTTATTTHTASAILTVATTPTAGIQFISASPTDIAIAGTGGVGRQDFSILLFKVTNVIGAPASGQEVQFSLQGIGSFEGGATTTALSDENGEVEVTVFSGAVPTNLVVIAQFFHEDEDIIITAPSSQLTVNGGLAVQDGMSIAFAVLNPHAYRKDNVENQITVTAHDRYNNPVPDDTSVTFTAEAGIIDGNCLTVNGSCSVTWRSQAYSAPANPDEPNDRNGRVSVLAYMAGEETFVDENGDGLFGYRAGGDLEFLVNIPEAFVDADENGVQSGTDLAFEEYIDSNGDNSYTSIGTENTFQGQNCDPNPDLDLEGLGHCTTLANIFASGTFVMASHVLYIDVFLVDSNGSVSTTPVEDDLDNPVPLTGAQKFAVIVYDENGNSPPIDTTIKIDVNGAELASSSDHKILGRTEPYQFLMTIFEDGTPPDSGLATVSIEAEIDGVISSRLFQMEY